jgi:hypothetical protein
MTTSLMDADSLLAIDVGAITTRAMFFDVVDGRYRYLASGSAPTTASAPFCDVREGVRLALDQLQSIMGRTLVGSDQRLIIPSQMNHSGVDTCVATISAGGPLKTVVVGLLDEVSAESAQKLATTTYTQVLDKLSLSDRRKSAARIDAILRLRPDLIIVAGGTDGGAGKSLMSLIESVGLACYLISREQRPEVLYAGNQNIYKEVETALGTHVNLTRAPNIRPTLEQDQLGPAQSYLTRIYRSIRIRKIAGVRELDSWASGRLMPTAAAFGRMVHFLSRVYDPSKGVLGVDVGASATVVAAAFAGNLSLEVYPELGLGENLSGMLRLSAVEDICRWLSVNIPEAYVRDYIYNKTLYPGSLPITPEELVIEQSILRRILQLAVRKIANSFPEGVIRYGKGLLPWFEPIVAAGSVFTQAPTRGQSLLMLLDGVQPTGVSTLVLDQNNILNALGAAATINHILPVQVLESSTFLNLGTVISLVGQAPMGAPALRVRVKYEGGSESGLDIKFGGLEVIPLPLGQSANLHLQPLNRFDVGMGGPGRGGSVRVVGGALGVVIDARGRPVRLPDDAQRRRDVLKKWLWTVGG